MSLAVTYTESPNTVIRSARWNRNFDDVEDWANAHEVAATGVHGVTGNIVGTTDSQTLSNKIFDLTDVKIYGGYDLKLYSDSGSTLKASIDGATGDVSLEGALDVTGTATIADTLSVNGNTGIGTSAPLTRLGGVLTAQVLTVHKEGTTGGTGSIIQIGTSDTSSAITLGGVDFYCNGVSGEKRVGFVSCQKIDASTTNTSGQVSIGTLNSGTLSTKMAIGATGAVGIISGQKLFLDGVALTGNTSIRESASDVMTFEVGGSDRLALNNSATGNQLAISSNTTTGDILDISAASLTSGKAIDISDAGALTGATSYGSLINLVSTSTSATSRNLMRIHQDASGAAVPLRIVNEGTGTALLIQQTAGTGRSILINHTPDITATAQPLEIVSSMSAATNVSAIEIDHENAGAGTASGIDLASSSLDYAFVFNADATDPTGGGGAAIGRVPVLIGGVTRYLAYY